MIEPICDPLERRRKACLALLGLGLVIELGGAVLIFCGWPAWGFALAGTGLALWLWTRLALRRRYQAAWAEARLRFGLGLADLTALSRAEAAALSLPTEKLIPKNAVGDAPLFVHAARGTLRGLPAVITELTVSYHRKDEQARRFVSGTLLALESAAPEGLAERLKAQCKDAALLEASPRTAVFFPHRFYSHGAELQTRVTPAALQADPLPEAAWLAQQLPRA